MALSGTARVDSGNSHYDIEIRWSATQSIEGNYSNVYAELWFYSDPTYSIGISNKSGNITIDGTPYSFTKSLSSGGGAWVMLSSASKTVYHDSNGFKKLEVSGNYNFAVTIGGSALGSPIAIWNDWLDTIPRASTGSTASWVFPNNFDISINSASSSFYHAIGIDILNNSTGSWEEIKTIWNVVGTATVNSNFTTTEQDHILSLLNVGSNYAEMTRIRVHTSTTSDNGNQIGYNEYVGGICSSPASSDITVNDFYIDNSGTTSVAISNIDNSYKRYVLTATLYGTNGTYTKTLLNSSQTPLSSISWDISKNTDGGSILDKLPSSNSGTIYWELTTYYYRNGLLGSTIGSKITKTCSVIISSNIKNPTWTNGVSVVEANTTIKTLLGANSPNYIVSGISKLETTLSSVATALRGTSIKEYNITINSNSKQFAGSSVIGNKITFNELELKTIYNSLTMTLNVVDYRGNVTSLTPISLNILQYAQPVINATALRESGYYSHTVLSLNGTFSPLTISGTNKNSIVSLQYQYKENVSGSAYGTLYSITKSGTAPNYIGTTLDINGSTGLDNQKQWLVKVLVTDKISTYSVELPVYVGVPEMFVDSEKRSVGVNKFPVNINSFEISGNEYLDGVKTTNVNIAPSSPNGGLVVVENVCSYSSNLSNITGILKITLPFGMNDVMFQMTIDGFNYGSMGVPSAFTLVLGGYAYSYGEFYAQTGDLTGKAPFGNNGTVRLAKDTTTNKACVLLGLTSTNVWCYPKINISKIMVGSSSFGYSNLRDGWDISFITTETNLSAITPINNVSELERTYPIGAIHINTNGTNPSVRMGGEWVAWGSGRVPVGVDTSQIEFNSVEKTGGEKTHTHTTSILGGNYIFNEGGVHWINPSGVDAVASSNYQSSTSSNLVPYITCYMWKRIA